MPILPSASSLLVDLAARLWYRFETTGNRQDLDWVIALGRLMLDTYPRGFPRRWVLLEDLAKTRSRRYKDWGDMADLERAIELRRDAVELCPQDHEGRFDLLTSLTSSLSNRHGRRGNPDDLDEIVEMQCASLSFLSVGHRYRSHTLSDLADSLVIRFRQRGSVKDLNEAIQLNRDVLALRLRGNPNRSRSLNSLASALWYRFKYCGSAEDLYESIQLHRDALALCPEGHPDRSMSLNNLASALGTRFDNSGRAEDLNEVIQLLCDSLSLHPEGYPSLVPPLNGLANVMRIRFQQSGRLDDLSESVRLIRECLALLPKGHPDFSASLCNLASSLRMRFEQTGSVDDLNESVQSLRDSLACRPERHPDRSSSLNNLGTALKARFEWSGNTLDLNESIGVHRDALRFLLEGHPNHSRMLLNLANTLETRFDKEGRPEDYEECIRSLGVAASHAFSSSLIRLRAAHRWATLARDHGHRTTLTAYGTAITLLGRALTIRPTLSAKHDLLTSNRQYGTLGVDAASYAIEKGDLPSAVEFLEQGRTLLWSQMRGLRTPLDRLSNVDKKLAERYEGCSRRMEAIMTSSDARLSGPSLSEGTRLVDPALQQLRRLSDQLEGIISEIRQVPGFEDFLQVLRFAKLHQAASEGPVIILNHSRFRCDALIVLSREDSPCVRVPLDGEWFDDAWNLCNDLLRARYEQGVHSLEYDATLRSAMKVVWDRVVSKVVQRLRELGITEGSRIWWCPTFYLSLLPFHAAGPYQTANSGMKHLLDDYISSYTPTLMSLITARSGACSERERMLFVRDSHIPATKKEYDAVRRHHRIGKYLVDEKASRESVIKALRKAEWVHFACHGSLNREKPFESSFALPGGKLTLLDVVKANLPNAEFAFLSACHTAELPPGSALDEALYLAAAIQFCGFRSVVGTMWQLLDRDGPLLAEAVYIHLMNEVKDGEPRFKAAAAAVRRAALFLRSQKDWTDDGREVDIATERWVNLVHIGA